MSVNLKLKHQQKTYELIKKAKKQGIKRIAYIYPTGGGKTFPALKEVEDEIKENPNKKILIVVPRVFILNKYKEYISEYILNGDKNIRKRLPNVRIITYSKLALANKITKLKPDMIIFDEIHRIGANTYRRATKKLLNNNPEADVRGSTATPERPDGKNMADEIFGENVIYEMSMTEALTGEKENEVVLKACKYFKMLCNFKQPIEKYKKQIDEIDDIKEKEKAYKHYEKLERTIANSPDMKDVMKKAIEKKNAKCIVICADREDMFEKIEQAHEIFGKVNEKIKIDYVISKDRKTGTGKTRKENNETLKEFEEREKGEELNLLFCVDMLNEGIHIDGIDVEVQFQETQSPLKYKQWIGRVMRPITEDDEQTVIVDAVNNWIRQIDTYREIEQSIIKGQKIINNNSRNHKDINKYDAFQLTAEEVEFIKVLDEIREFQKYKRNDIHNEIIQWLETHNGNYPRNTIKRDGKKVNTNNATDEEKIEMRLYNRWNSSKEFEIYKKYKGKSIEVVPEEYKENIKEIRKFVPEIWDEMFKWYEEHDGVEPRAMIYKDGKILSASELSPEETRELRLRNKWKKSLERQILEQNKGVSLENISKEYREYIEKMRSYGKGLETKTAFEETIEWIETHKGIFPRNAIREKGYRKHKKKDEMTEDENTEVKLRSRWNNSKERKIYDKYKLNDILEIPEEFRKIVIKIKQAIQQGKDKYIFDIMQQAVKDNISTNEDVRKTLDIDTKNLEDDKRKI